MKEAHNKVDFITSHVSCIPLLIHSSACFGCVMRRSLPAGGFKGLCVGNETEAHCFESQIISFRLHGRIFDYLDEKWTGVVARSLADRGKQCFWLCFCAISDICDMLWLLFVFCKCVDTLASNSSSSRASGTHSLWTEGVLFSRSLRLLVRQANALWTADEQCFVSL